MKTTKEKIFGLLGLKNSSENNKEINKNEAIERLINIELKINKLLAILDSNNKDTVYTGHPDQAFGSITYSQHGEDLFVVTFFHLIGIRNPSYLDIGAHHPTNISNTALLYTRGSRGINIEANPNLMQKFYEFRPDDLNLNIGIADQNGFMTYYMIDDFSGRNTFDKKTADEFVQSHPEFSISATKEIPVMKLDDVVNKYCDGIYPDFLTIDVEGLDESILKASSISDKNGPKLICVETCSGDDSDSSLGITKFLTQRGYDIYIKTIGNILFTQKTYTNIIKI